MPRPSAREETGLLYQGAGQAFSLAWELVVATAVWAAIGYGLDRLFGTWPWLFGLGAFVGHGAGIYIVYRALGQDGRARSQGGSANA